MAISDAHPGPVGTVGNESRGLSHAREFIIDDILAAQPGSLQDVLLRISIVDRFCAPLLDALGDDSDRAPCGEEWLVTLKRANLFITSLDPEAPGIASTICSGTHCGSSSRFGETPTMWRTCTDEQAPGSLAKA